MNKILKITLWPLGIILGLLLLVMALSPVIKYVANHYGERLIGREILVDGVLINPFSGAVTIRDFHLREANGETDFVAFTSLYVQVNYPALMAKKVSVRHLHLADLTAQVLTTDQGFNFSDLIERFAPADTTAVEQEPDTVDIPSSWTMALNDMRLSNGHLVYHDLSRNHRWAVENINLHVPGLYFGSQQSNAGLGFDLPTGGNIHLTAGYVMARRRYALTLTLSDVATEYLQPIFDDIELIKAISAKVSGKIHLDGGLDAIEDFRANVDLSLTGLDLGETLNMEGLKVRDFHYTVESLNIAGEGISLRNANNSITLRAKLSDGGRLNATYTGSLDPKTGNGHLGAKLTGVVMPRFSPITEALMAYPIEDGTMAFESNTDIRAGQLLSLNRLTMDQLKIGNRKRLTRAPYKNIPLKTGVRLLQSAGGIIVLDLPVEGDINSPKFDFKKIIGRVFMKVFFGPLMGVNDNRKLISADELEELEELMGDTIQ